MSWSVYQGIHFQKNFKTYKEAYDWAENNYGSKQDGICVEEVTFVENSTSLFNTE